MNRMAVSSFVHFRSLTGRCCESYGMRVTRVSIAAIFALSKSGAFAFRAGSTSVQCLPWAVSYSYQNRSLSSA